MSTLSGLGCNIRIDLLKTPHVGCRQLQGHKKYGRRSSCFGVKLEDDLIGCSRVCIIEFPKTSFWSGHRSSRQMSLQYARGVPVAPTHSPTHRQRSSRGRTRLPYLYDTVLSSWDRWPRPVFMAPRDKAAGHRTRFPALTTPLLHSSLRDVSRCQEFVAPWTRIKHFRELE